MLHSISKKIQLLCENSKNVVLGFLIEPICKRRYCFIIFKANNQMSLLMGQHDTTEFLDFIKAYVPEGCSFSEFHNRIAVSEPFVAAYKSRFFSSQVITDGDTIQLIEEVYNLDFSTPKTWCGGLDGFSMDCYIAGEKEELHLWCYYYDEYYLPVAKLANKMLSLAGVNEDWRFHLIMRPECC